MCQRDGAENILGVKNGRHERKKELSSLSNAVGFFFLPLSCLQLGLTFSPLFSQCHNEFTEFSELLLFDGENKIISVLVTCHSLFILCRITRLVLPCFLIFIFHTVELNYIRNKRKRSPSFAFGSLSTFIFLKLKGPSS